MAKFKVEAELRVSASMEVEAESREEAMEDACASPMIMWDVDHDPNFVTPTSVEEL